MQLSYALKIVVFPYFNFFFISFSGLEGESVEDRVAELRHRLRIEAAVLEGAKNVIRSLQSSTRGVPDKKALHEVNKILFNDGYTLMMVNYMAETLA